MQVNSKYNSCNPQLTFFCMYGVLTTNKPAFYEHLRF